MGSLNFITEDMFDRCTVYSFHQSFEGAGINCITCLETTFRQQSFNRTIRYNIFHLVRISTGNTYAAKRENIKSEKDGANVHTILLEYKLL